MKRTPRFWKMKKEHIIEPKFQCFNGVFLHTDNPCKKTKNYMIITAYFNQN